MKNEIQQIITIGAETGESRCKTADKIMELFDGMQNLLADSLIDQHEIRVGLDDGGELPGWAVRKIEDWKTEILGRDSGDKGDELPQIRRFMFSASFYEFPDNKNILFSSFGTMQKGFPGQKDLANVVKSFNPKALNIVFLSICELSEGDYNKFFNG